MLFWNTVFLEHVPVSSGRGGSGVGGREMARRQDREKIDHQWLLLTIKIETTYPWDYNRED